MLFLALQHLTFSSVADILFRNTDYQFNKIYGRDTGN